MRGDRTAIITCLNDDNSVFRVTGCVEYGVEQNSYRICGTNGQIENIRGGGGKLSLLYNSWSTPEGAQKNSTYKPDWPEEYKELIEQSGHGGGDFFVIKEFFDCIRKNRKPIIDEYFATTTASVAILGHRSVLDGGTPYDIPDFRKEEDRKKYENDHLTPFYGRDGSAPTISCSSHPDYRPHETQMKNYLDLIGY